LRIVGFLGWFILAFVETTIEISGEALVDAMRFTGAKAKRDSVVRALEEFDCRRRFDQFIQEAAGSMPDFPGNDGVEATDVEWETLLRRLGRREGDS